MFFDVSVNHLETIAVFKPFCTLGDSGHIAVIQRSYSGHTAVIQRSYSDQ